MKHFYICIFFISLFSCDNAPYKFTITKTDTMPAIPAASGVIDKGNDLYVISDNTSFIYKLKKDYSIDKKLQIIHNGSNDIYSKKDKFDFEAITVVKWGKDKEFLIFGSGSKENRETLARIDFDKKPRVKTYNLDEFYDKIVSSTSLRKGDINIEAATIKDNDLYLFNRGKNMLLVVNVKDFKDYLKGKKKAPKPKSYKIHLPDYNGTIAGFSGATIIPDEKKILFTASLEDQYNHIHGSYIGLIHITELENHYEPKCIIIKNSEGNVLEEKVEAITVKSLADFGSAHIVLVTDNDNNISHVIEGTFRW